jgi:predicted DNA-binding WGR domain protein
MKRYFEFVGADDSRVSGKAEKFWEIDVVGSDVLVRFGKIGSAGQTTVKQHADSAAANLAAEKLVNEKLRKGYTELTKGVSEERNKDG